MTKKIIRPKGTINVSKLTDDLFETHDADLTFINAQGERQTDVIISFDDKNITFVLPDLFNEANIDTLIAAHDPNPKPKRMVTKAQFIDEIVADFANRKNVDVI